MTDHNDTNENTAKQIMDNPAAAAGEAAAPILTSPHITDPGTAKLLNELPGLVGAIDSAIKETSGKNHAFMLMIFTPGTALHCTNAHPQQVQAAVVELVEKWKEDPALDENPDTGA